MIDKINISQVVDRCNTINELNEEGLKLFYKEQLKIPRGDGKYEGRVGLINVARKSGHSFDYEIKRIDRKHSFFILCVKIPKE